MQVYWMLLGVGSLCFAQCPPGTTDDDNNILTPCVNCTAGTYSTGDNVGPCTTCDSGAYALEGSENCTWCLPGTTDDDGDPSTPCTDCPLGTRSIHCCRIGPCQACDAGTYAAAGSPTCTKCLPGTTDDDFNASTPCVDCSAGYHNTETGLVGECPVCSGGTYAAPGSENCTACLPGTSDDDRDPSTPCVDCPPGHYNPNPRLFDECPFCDIGQYASAGSVNCTNCLAGTTDDDHDPSTPCVKCPWGTTSLPRTYDMCPLPSPLCPDTISADICNRS